MDLGRAQWAGSLHASHADRKETKPTGLNGTTRAVSLPNFIVIKVPDSTSSTHLCGPVFALVPEYPSP